MRFHHRGNTLNHSELQGTLIHTATMAAKSWIPATALYVQGGILTGVSIAALWQPQRFYEGVKDPVHGPELARLVKMLRFAPCLLHGGVV